MIVIKYVNNDGGGTVEDIRIESNTTVGLFLDQRGIDTDENTVRVNRKDAQLDYVLQGGDRVSVTPTKIEGGC